MKIRAHLVVDGRVQGVFFRSRTVEKACKIGVTGWVRNLLDDIVEAVFEGDKEAVEEMINFCRIDPPRALV
ncbi:MAG: acylphosphatase [Candidatus Bathyarchaeota archaeon]